MKASITETQEHRDAWEQYKAAEVAYCEAFDIYSSAVDKAREDEPLAVSERNAAHIAFKEAKKRSSQAWATLLAAEVPTSQWEAWQAEASSKYWEASAAVCLAERAVREEFALSGELGPAWEKAEACRKLSSVAGRDMDLLRAAQEAAECVLT